jgi:hypothetical protein
MSILTSGFDVITHDPLEHSKAGLALVLTVASAPAPGSGGTPTAGSIPAGSIIVMNSSGLAILADNDTTATTNAPSLMFVTVDGDQDYDGSFVHKITCVQGGIEILTPQVYGTSFTPGGKLTCGQTSGTACVGKFRTATTGEQIYGIVGPLGYNATTALLDVIIPQGICPAAV